jgi:hypothetical protein
MGHGIGMKTELKLKCQEHYLNYLVAAILCETNYMWTDLEQCFAIANCMRLVPGHQPIFSRQRPEPHTSCQVCEIRAKLLSFAIWKDVSPFYLRDICNNQAMVHRLSSVLSYP